MGFRSGVPPRGGKAPPAERIRDVIQPFEVRVGFGGTRGPVHHQVADKEQVRSVTGCS